ncbi:unnamed protein product [Prorocentrum cordatum]|uniref:Mono(ADP-ribosyl)transferase n=1 Tax=Prorocentrum cordatum TaxID=2364126 RepID=A0ABN9V5Z3_9DINO|nr:unnamed protein product [Polarella glacialis]
MPAARPAARAGRARLQAGLPRSGRRVGRAGGRAERLESQAESGSAQEAAGARGRPERPRPGGPRLAPAGAAGGPSGARGAAGRPRRGHGPGERAASLASAAGAGMSAKSSAAEVSGQSSVQQVEVFMALVEQQWSQKERTLLQELCANLRQPKGALSIHYGQTGGMGEAPVEAEALTLRTLAEVCSCAQEKYGSKPLNAELQVHLLSICCWVVYTMQDVDIDRLFGFPDCPVLPPGMEEPALRDAVYNEYRARIKGGRCPQMFSAANWAARVCFDKGGDVSTEAGRDALAGVQTWVKWLCFLGASARDLEEPVTVTRGLCGLPEQLVDDFRCTRAGDCIFWAAPSSTTDDARISDSYCNQQEPKERNVLFTISGVTRAFPMFELSQYPDEREWLLPPFCNLRVDRVVDGAPVQVECTFVGCMMSGPLCEKVVRDFKQASRDLGRVLSTMEEELSAQKKQLEQTRRRGLVCTRAVFRAGLLLLARRPPGGGASPLEHLLRDFRARARPPPRGAPPRPSALPQAAATARAGGVAASLESAVGASLGAKSSAAEVSGGCSRQQVDSFMELVQRQWEQKDLTLLQELCGSLRQPKAARGMLGRQADSTGAAPVEAEAVTPRTLAEVCSCVRERYARKPLNEQLQGHLLSTCCWALCTMQDGDIDRLFGFLDCPTLPPGMKEPALRDAAYNEYRARCKGDRCPHMFSVANWAARVCFDKGGDVSTEAGRDALAGLQKWIKWLCFLGASARDLEEPVTVTRGLCGLPEQLVDDLRRKQAGDCIFWAAPSSTTDDVRISDDYCSQQTPRERNVLFTISGVTQAFPMFELSQYPQEREWLLPPFCELWVNRVFDGAPLRVECTFVGCMLPAALRERAVRDLEKASQDLCAALDTEEEEELSALGRRLAEARRRSVQEAPPLPVRRAQPRPLHARDLVGGPPAAGQGAAEGARERPEELARTWRPASQEDQHQGEPELDEDLESEPEAEEPMEVRLSASGPPMHVYRPTSASRVRHSRRSGS